ncbi:DNA mismatch repair protein MutS [candidate division WOR-3 bacterium]|nr:DNA mismatch repair protein MutS [candidate division WOR-3 bacterium]
MTPILKQYRKIKKKYQDSVLLFHIGDFYETFYDDAKIASEILNITLTSKPMGKDVRIPLAGIPIKAADSYIEKLVHAGKKVAICEQVEDPKASKGLVEREVIEVITSGTVMRPSLLNETDNNYLFSIIKNENTYGIAFSDISTGEFQSGEIRNLTDELNRLSPKELIIPEGMQIELPDTIPVTKIESYRFDRDFALELIKDHFGVLKIDAFGLAETSPAVCAAGALLSYINENQKTTLKHIKKISRFNPRDGMSLDGATIKNLELITKINGNQKGALLDAINKTLTPMGSRLLKKWLLFPSTNKLEIEKRFDGIEELIFKRNILREIREKLKEISDIERITGRISTSRATPRDLISLKTSLSLTEELKKIVLPLNSPIFKNQAEKIKDLKKIITLIETSIVEDPPAKISDAGIFRKGYSAELDEIRTIATEGKNWVFKYEKEQRNKTGIDKLKIGYNSVFGYYIEITKAKLKGVPENYIKKQTLTNSERFITEELKDFESKILTAEERQNEIEKQLFEDLIKKLQNYIGEFEETASGVSLIDVIANFTEVALTHNYSRPKITNTKGIKILEGRHPVVEAILQEGEFIPNNVDLNQRESIIILTGPNMAGKSTYLRQIALVTIMAQIGSYVPAKNAEIGIIDSIFTRIGASDDLARGVSTFLAEMNETANILNNVTSKSLVLLDEVGRGTSTYDGLSIAWSVIEYLNSIPEKPLVLFATHYHELTELEEYYKTVVNYNVSVKETENEVIFLRNVERGSSDRSYGIEVARLAGLPDNVIRRAKDLLADLRDDDRVIRKHPPKTRQNSLFQIENILLNKIKSLDPDNMTPKEAHNALYDLKKEIKKE